MIIGLYRINTIPIGVWTDEIEISMAGKGALDSMMDTKNFIPFTPEATGHPGLTAILTGMGINVFGKTIMGLRFPSVLFGALGALAFYYLLREKFSMTTSFLVSLLFSSSYWHLSLSRLAYEASFYWFFQVLCLIFLIRFLKYKSIKYLSLVGLFAGLGIYTYLAFRIFAIGLIFVILLSSLIQKIKPSKIILGLIIFSVSLGAVISPIFIYSRQWPEQIYQRSSDLSVFNPKFDSINRVQMIADNSLKTLMMLGIKGDPNYRHNPAQKPVLDFLTFVLLIWGTIQLFKKKDYSMIAIIAIVGAISAANGVFTYEPPYITQPHSLRTLGIMPLLYLTIAYAFDFLKTKLKTKPIPFLLILVIIGINLYTYFNVPVTPALADATQYNFTQVSLIAAKSCDKALVISPSLINQTHYNFFASKCKYTKYDKTITSETAFFILDSNDSQILQEKGSTNYVTVEAK